MKNKGGIALNYISYGMVIEVMCLLNDKTTGVPVNMGEYLVVNMITNDLIKEYKKPMMEINLSHRRRSNSTICLWSPTGGVHMYSYPGRRVPFLFKRKDRLDEDKVA